MNFNNGRDNPYKQCGIIVILAASLAIAQGPDTLWTKTYGGPRFDRGNSAQQTSDSGHIIAGYTESSGAGVYDVFLVRTNDQGIPAWSKTYGGVDADVGSFACQTSDGGFVAAGYTHSFGAGYCDFYLVKTNSRGDTMWTRTYGGALGDWCAAVGLCNDGGYILVGWTNSYGAGESDVLLIKTNSNGGALWQRTYGGPRFDAGYSVQQTSDSGYVIAGTTVSFGAGSYDLYLIKVDKDGDAMWSRAYGGAGEDWGWSVDETTDSGYVMAGYTHSFGSADGDVFIVKTNEDGDTVWTKRHGGPRFDQGTSVQQTNDGGYVIAGSTYSFGTGYADVFVVRTNATGDTLWTKRLGGALDDAGLSIQQTGDGGYIVGGYTRSFGAGGYDVYLLRLANELSTEENRISDLHQTCFEVYPSIIRRKCSIGYTMRKKSEAALSLYDVSGRMVRQICARNQEAGTYHEVLDVTDPPQGIYFVRFSAGDHSETRKIVLIK